MIAHVVTHCLPMVKAMSHWVLSGEYEELGVPEAPRERVQLALFDLANHLDSGSVTWPLMRDAVTLVMHYPALGRQALPLLLPFLENAA